jgi:PAS domain S-box-containing protein
MENIDQLGFETFLNVLPTAAMVVRVEDGMVLLINEDGLNSLKVRRADTIGRLSPNFWVDSERHAEFLAILDNKGRAEDFTTTLRRGDGQLVNVICSTTELLMDGERVRFTVYKDVTPLVQTNQALHEQNEILRREVKKSQTALKISDDKIENLVNQTLQGILVHRDGRALFVNKTFSDLFGYSSGEILSLDQIMVLTARSDRERLIKSGVDQLKNPNAPHQFQIQALKKDGTHFPIFSRSELVEWEGRTAILTTVFDVTDEVSAKRELERMNRELEFRVAERTRELGESEARLRSAVKIAKFGHGSWSPSEEIYLHCSPEHASFFGLTPADFVGKPSKISGRLSMVHPDDEALLVPARAKLRLGQPTDIDYRIIDADGRMRWIRQASAPVLDQFGAVTEVQFVSQDTTDRKTLEEQLRDSNVTLDALVQKRTNELAASEAKFRTAALSSQFGLAVVRNNRFLFANDAWAEILGYTLEEILNHESAIDLLDAQDRRQVADLAKARANGRTDADRFEVRARRKDGTLVWLDNAEQRIDWDGEQAVLISILDITEQIAAKHEIQSANKELEQRVEERTRDLGTSEDRIKTAVKIAGIGFGTWSYTENHYTHCSPEYAAICGVDASEFIGQTRAMTDLMPDEDIELFETEIAKVARGEQIDIQHQIINGHGQIRWLRQICVPVLDVNGNVVEARFVGQDITDSKQLEETLLDSNRALETEVQARTTELAGSERKFRSLAESSQVGLAVIRDNKFLFVNQSWANIYGFELDEMMAYSAPIELVAPMDRPKIANAIAERRKQGITGPLRLELRGRRKDRSVVWLDNLRHLIDWEGAPALLISILDITERKANEAALTDSQNLVSSLLENSPFAFSIKDRDRRHLMFNAGPLNVLKQTSREMQLNDRVETFNLETETLIEAADRKVLETGVTVGIDEELHLEIDDTVVRLIKFPIQHGSGSVERIGTIAIDVTAEVEARRRLRESERVAKEIFELSIIGAAVYSRKPNRITFANTRLLEILGVTREQLMERPPRWMWTELSVLKDVTGRLRRDGSCQEFVELRKADGAPVWCMFSCKTSPNSSDEVMFWVQDLTDLHDTQIALIEAKEGAEKADRAKTDFLSAMSHELRTPLNAVLGFAQLLEADAETSLDDDQSMAVRMILSSGELLLSLINEVLDLTGIQDGNVKVDRVPVRVEVMLGECVDLITPLADSRGLSTDVDMSGFRGQEILADRVRVKQIVLNLLQNAVKYNRDDGKVTVHGGLVGQNRVRIIVSDTGNGIAEKDIAAVFNPFERLGEAQGTIEGTGIGLTIAKRLIEAMDGSIGVTSELGKGSDFWIELPAPGRMAPSAPALVEITTPF